MDVVIVDVALQHAAIVWDVVCKAVHSENNSNFVTLSFKQCLKNWYEFLTVTSYNNHIINYRASILPDENLTISKRVKCFGGDLGIVR